MINTLHDIELFEGISDDEYTWLLENSREVTLEKGEYISREGEPSDLFYVVLDGEMQISRTNNGQLTVLGTTPRGIIGGELALLSGKTKMHVNAQAIMPSRLMTFDADAFRRMFGACPTVSTRVLQIATERMGGLATRVTQQEKMAALGKLSAGLAHELNNPAAAARRASNLLREMLPVLQSMTITLCKLGLSEAQIKSLIAFQHDAIVNAAEFKTPLSALERADREDELGEWLDARDVAHAWEMAATFVTSGVTREQLETLAGNFGPTEASGIILWMGKALMAATVLDDIEQSTSRISDLVAAVKQYTFMDQAPQQEVDIHAGLDNTLKVMKYKLKDIEVVRQYADDLPRVMARGGELNQVWTNIIDNATDAMQGKGTLHLITRCENNFVMVEITDDGPGIPADVLPRIFEPFFTTKGVGSGTGLGLDIVYRIVQEHGGTLDVQSRPGQTRFIIRLPLMVEMSAGVVQDA